MEKANIVKNIIIKSLLGFTLGVTLLMIAYISVYFVANENIFVNEIAQLHNIKTLISQVVVNGFSYFVLFIGLNALVLIQDKEFTEKYMNKRPYLTIITLNLIFIITIAIIVSFLSNIVIYSKNITTLNLVILTIISVLFIMYSMIKNFTLNILVKDINKKLKEKN